MAAAARTGLRREGVQRAGSLLPLALACTALAISIGLHFETESPPDPAKDRDLLRARVTNLHREALAIRQRLLDLEQACARRSLVRVEVPRAASANVTQQLQSRIDLLWLAILSGDEGLSRDEKSTKSFFDFLSSLSYYRRMALDPLQLPQERVRFLSHASRFHPQSANFDEALRRAWAELVPVVMGDAAMLRSLALTIMQVDVDDVVRPGLIAMLQHSRADVRDCALTALRDDLADPTVRGLVEHMARTDPSPGLRSDAQGCLATRGGK